MSEANYPPKQFPTIRIMDEGRVIVRNVVGIAGDKLVCQGMGGGEWLVSSRMAQDESEFWDLWKQLGGSKACWEDGTPYNPTV